MAFPTTVDAAVSSAEQPGKYGPFLVGSDRYEVLFNTILNTGGSATMAVRKSTDGGVTWAAVGTGTAPTTFIASLGQFAPYAACQAGTTLLIAYQDQGLGGLSLVRFTCGADTFGSPVPIPSPPGPVSSGEGNFPLYQMSFAYSSFDNTALLLLAGDQVTLADVPHSICAFVRYDVSGDTWGAWVDLDFSDYSDITTWDQVPCGLVIDPSTGAALALMQQVSRAGPGTPQAAGFVAPGDDTFTVPLDAAAAAQVDVWGAGAGPPSVGGAVSDGGGAGAFSRLNALAWTPGATFNLHVGAGGAPATDGEDSWFDTTGTVLAKGGKAAGAGGSAGAGVGDVKFSGGAGGVAGATGGGGGGGAGGPAGDGGDGSPGGAPLGGPGGTGNPPGGDGGDGGDVDFAGTAGDGPGGGAGGWGDASPPDPSDPQGATGEVNLAWTSIRNTHDCRMWQQTINPDDSIGTLTEISAGAFPARPRLGAPIPISFDAAILAGVVSIAFTGATSTSGRNNISVGRGALANPVSFSFATFSCGNGSNGADSCPAIAPSSAGLFCCYISAPTAGPVAFVYRVDAGSGFGAPVSIGTLSSGDLRAASRLQAKAFSGAPEVTFGVPTAAYILGFTPG